MHGFTGNPRTFSIADIDHALAEPTDKRIFVIAQAMMKGYSVEHTRTHKRSTFGSSTVPLANIVSTSDEL